MAPSDRTPREFTVYVCPECGLRSFERFGLHVPPGHHKPRCLNIPVQIRVREVVPSPPEDDAVNETLQRVCAALRERYEPWPWGPPPPALFIEEQWSQLSARSSTSPGDG